MYCGDLDRYVELTGTVAREYGQDRGYGLASYVDGLQSCGRIEEALELAEDVGRRGAIARQPLLGLLRALDRRDGVLQGRREARVRGLGRGCHLRA